MPPVYEQLMSHVQAECAQTWNVLRVQCYLALKKRRQECFSDGIFCHYHAVFVQVESTDSMDKLAEMVQMISGIPSAKQKLVLGQKVLPKTGTISAAGVIDGDLLQLHPSSNPFEQAPDGSALDPDAFMAAIRQNPDIMQRVAAHNKSLEAAIQTGNASQLQDALRQVSTASCLVSLTSSGIV
jgi:hypothetical protein